MDKEIKRIRNLVKDIDPEVGILDREGEFLYKLASRLPPGGCIVEIGSWKGRSTIWLGVGAMKSGNIVYAVDPHTGTSSHEREGELDTYKAFLQNIERARLDNSVVPLRMTSREALHSKEWKDIRMVFIDGEHNICSVGEDYTGWSLYLDKDSIVALHDTIGYEGPRIIANNCIIKGGTWKVVGVCGQIVAARSLAYYKDWYKLNLYWWVYWKLYSLLFLLATKLPKFIKERLK